MLQITISNVPNLEDQLFQLYVKVTGIIHDFMLEDFDDMPSFEDITDVFFCIILVTYIINVKFQRDKTYNTYINDK